MSLDEVLVTLGNEVEGVVFQENGRGETEIKFTAYMTDEDGNIAVDEEGYPITIAACTYNESIDAFTLDYDNYEVRELKQDDFLGRLKEAVYLETEFIPNACDAAAWFSAVIDKELTFSRCKKSKNGTDTAVFSVEGEDTEVQINLNAQQHYHAGYLDTSAGKPKVLAEESYILVNGAIEPIRTLDGFFKDIAGRYGDDADWNITRLSSSEYEFSHNGEVLNLSVMVEDNCYVFSDGAYTYTPWDYTDLEEVLKFYKDGIDTYSIKMEEYEAGQGEENEEQVDENSLSSAMSFGDMLDDPDEPSEEQEVAASSEEDENPIEADLLNDVDSVDGGAEVTESTEEETTSENSWGSEVGDSWESTSDDEWGSAGETTEVSDPIDPYEAIPTNEFETSEVEDEIADEYSEENSEIADSDSSVSEGIDSAEGFEQVSEEIAEVEQDVENVVTNEDEITDEEQVEEPEVIESESSESVVNVETKNWEVNSIMILKKLVDEDGKVVGVRASYSDKLLNIPIEKMQAAGVPVDSLLSEVRYISHRGLRLTDEEVAVKIFATEVTDDATVENVIADFFA